MAGTSVIVIGGGIAGLSAAHELRDRGFLVDVYERRDVPGGKARSFHHNEGGLTYPAEHGFRFFPRFYRHVTDTMRRIPYSRGSIADNLVECSEALLARDGKAGFRFLTWFPRSVSEWRRLLATVTAVGGLGLPQEELNFFVKRVWQLMTSCAIREANDYERIGWWEYLEADERSQTYRDFLVGGITRNLIAAKPTTASARVGGKIFAELMFGLMRPGASNDRVLNGPTSDKWIEPWVGYLHERGVRFHMSTAATAINCARGRVESVTIKDETGSRAVNADFYVLAVPVERAAGLISPEMLAIDPTLDVIRTLANDAKKMVGIQFFLRREMNIAKGHVSFVDSKWALTAISQAQYWDVDLLPYGGGHLRDILSVDISDWDAPGLLYDIADGTRKKMASECTPDEVAHEVWEQMKRALNLDGHEVLSDDDPLCWCLCGSCVGSDDEDRLLVNMKNSWAYRPEAYTRIPNLFLASDYVRTNTSLATMEAANEAARRAVNAILDAAAASRVTANVDLRRHCRIWSLSKPWVLAPLRTRDSIRYELGQAWDERDPPGWLGLAYHLIVKVLAGMSKSGRRIEDRLPNSKRNIRQREKAHRDVRYDAFESAAPPPPPSPM